MCPLHVPHCCIFVRAATHSDAGFTLTIFLAISAAEPSACSNVRVATNERFIWPVNFSGTSPNGFNCFMCSLTQPKYLNWKELKEKKNKKRKFKLINDNIVSMQYNGFWRLHKSTATHWCANDSSIGINYTSIESLLMLVSYTMCMWMNLNIFPNFQWKRKANWKTRFINESHFINA